MFQISASTWSSPEHLMMKITTTTLVKKNGRSLKVFLVVARRKNSSIIYIMQAKLCKEVNTIENSFTELWHKWLGHICEKELVIFARKKLISIKDMLLRTCTHCLIGKQYRVAFHKFPSCRRSRALGLIYTDVCNIDARTLGGALYFII